MLNDAKISIEADISPSRKHLLQTNLELLGNLLKSNILIYMKIEKTFLILNAVHRKNYEECIKIIFKDGIYHMVIGNKNIERKGTTFCLFCFRSYKNFKAHHCKTQQKCYHCFRYFRKTSYSNDTCSNIIKPNEQVGCLDCQKISRNESCTRTHIKNGSRFCRIVKTCKLCNAVYRSKHQCLKRICHFCFNFHQKSDFCPLIPTRQIRCERIQLMGLKSENCLLLTTFQRSKCVFLRYLYFVNLSQNACDIFEFNTDIKTLTLLNSMECYAKTFDELCLYLNLDSSIQYWFFVDAELFEYFQDLISEKELPTCNSQINNSSKISAINFKKTRIFKLDSLCKETYFSLYLNFKNKDDINVFTLSQPDCVKDHGLKNLQIKCYLSTIRSTSESLYNLLLISEEKMRDIRKMSMNKFTFTSLHNKAILLINYFDEVNDIGKQLSKKTINIFDFSTFSQFSYALIQAWNIYNLKSTALQVA